MLRGEKVSKDNLDDDVRAEVTTDQQLREVVFGDPVMHMVSRLPSILSSFRS